MRNVTASLCGAVRLSAKPVESRRLNTSASDKRSGPQRNSHITLICYNAKINISN